MKQTPLDRIHRSLNGRMVEFGGWEMPVQYTNLLEEHHAVRKRAGLFDVSHMGEFEVSGRGAFDLIQKVITKDISKMEPGKMVLGVMCTEQGGIIDDLTVYKFSPLPNGDERYWIVVNAGTKDKDLTWIQGVRDREFPDVIISDLTDGIAKLDLQGPLSLEILKKLTKDDLSRLTFYTFMETFLLDSPCVVSQSGYTGEYGFEIYCASRSAEKIWNEILKKGAPWGLLPCGLGARDTLRTEAGMMLYGNDIDETTTPFESVYSFVVSLEKEFIGKQSLIMQKDLNFLPKKICGFEMVDRGIARHLYEVYDSSSDEQASPIGWVTSGTPSPTLEKNIGMAYVPMVYTKPGTEFYIKIRDTRVKARVIKLPFYKRPL